MFPMSLRTSPDPSSTDLGFCFGELPQYAVAPPETHHQTLVYSLEKMFTHDEAVTNLKGYLVGLVVAVAADV